MHGLLQTIHFFVKLQFGLHFDARLHRFDSKCRGSQADCQHDQCDECGQHGLDGAHGWSGRAAGAGLKVAVD